MKHFWEWMMKLLVMSNFEFPLQSVTVYQIHGWSEKILYCGRGCVSAWVISKNLCLCYGLSAQAGTEFVHLLFSWLPPQQRSIFGHSTCSHRKHYIIVSLKSRSGYAGHLTGTLYNLDYCFKKTLWGEPTDVFWGLVWEPDPADTYWPKLYLTGATRPVGLFAWLCSSKELFAGLSPHSLVDRTHLSLGGLWALQKPAQGSHFQKQRLCQSTPRTLCLCVL